MGEVVVRSLKGMQQQVIAGRHSLVADEPLEWDGDDLGPNPYELLLAALGTCINMTLFIFARRNEWDLWSVESRLVHDRVFGEDCLHCEEEGEFMDRVQQFVTVRGRLSPEQLSRLAEIAGKCPVHKTLVRGMQITDILVEAAGGDEDARAPAPPVDAGHLGGC